MHKQRWLIRNWYCLTAGKTTDINALVRTMQAQFHNAAKIDETNIVQKMVDEIPGLTERVRLLPACSPDKVWEYLCGADIFAFPSHKEGIPNSLLEAMAMSVPAIAFAIPPMLEIEAGAGGLVVVTSSDSRLFSQAILRLAASSDERARIGEKGRAQVMDRFMVRKNMAEALQRLAKVVEKQSHQVVRMGV